MGKHVVSGA